MARTDDLGDIGLAVYLLRGLMDWSQADLSRESGVDKGLISGYEKGKVKPSRKNLGRLVKPAGVDLEFFDQLVVQCHGIRQTFEKARCRRRSGAPVDAAAASDLEGRIMEEVREGMAPYLLQLSQPDREPAPQPEDRAWAEEQWSIMEPLPAEIQSLFVEILEGDERSWAVAERLCRASEALAAEQPGEALRLARLAVQLAEQVPGTASWRRRLRGWCERFVAHASGGPRRLDLKAPLLF